MTTLANDTMLPPSGAPAATPMQKTRPLYWSVRRELWENSAIYIAPLAVAGLFLLGFLFGSHKLPDAMRAALSDPEKAHALTLPYDIAAIAIIVTSIIVGAFYCLDALHGERRDRTILFWKSLPVSDITVVLSKALVPLAVLPLVAFAVIEVLQLLMLLINTTVLASDHLGVGLLWERLSWLEGSVVLLYGLAVNALWYAPIYGWLTLVSGWAKRVTFLWALLTPLAICLVEAIAFHTSYFAHLLAYRLAGGFAEAFDTQFHEGALNMHLSDLDPARFLSTPGLWLGLIVAAGLFAAAVLMRRYREPI